MNLVPVRLGPGADLRLALEAAAASEGLGSAFVIAGIGSLSHVRLRTAGEPDFVALAGRWEILTLSGSLTTVGAHLHIAIADAAGQVLGGHLGHGSTVNTTAEVLLAPLAGWTLTREHDATIGHDELVVRRSG